MRAASRVLALLLCLACLSASCAGTRGHGKPYISVIAKGYQHQFWQVVKNGAFKAQADFDVVVNFLAPQYEGDVAAQLELFEQELAKKPDAICIAAQDADAVLPMLAQAELKNIPVIAFDSGIPDAGDGQIAALAATDNRAAAAVAAEKLYESARDKVLAATESNPAVFTVLAQDYTSGSLIDRSDGFAEKLAELAEKDGIQAQIGFVGDSFSSSLQIIIAVAQSTEISDIIVKARDALAPGGLCGVFCSNEGAANGLLALLESGASLPEGCVVVGFDAGERQKDAVRSGLFLGSVTQDPYMIGYKAVELAARSAAGESVNDEDTGAKWYNSSNMDDEQIKMLLYN